MSSLGYGNKLDVWEIFAHLFCEPELDGRVVLTMDDKNRVARFPQLLQCWNHSMCPCQQGVVCDVPCRIMVVCEVIIDERSRIPASKGSWSQKIFDTRKRKKERKTTPMLPPAWFMSLLQFQVGPSLYVIPKQTFQELRVPKDYCLLLKVSTSNRRVDKPPPISPKWEPLGSHMVGWENLVPPGYPHYDWVDHRW